MKFLAAFLLIFFFSVVVSNGQTTAGDAAENSEVTIKKDKKKKKKKKYRLPKVDLTHWKVTIPEGSGKGGAISVRPPEILDYANNEMLKPYMYNDSTSGALVFYAYPSKATTANTKYSRSELREQMEAGDDNVNWTFADGGYLKAKMSVPQISKDSDGKPHRTIVVQIHGRLTNDQRDEIGQKDNNAPPILKIYWKEGKIRVKTKVLKNRTIDNTEILHEDAWGDDEGRTFKEEVGSGKFLIEVKVSDGKMVVSLNKNEFFVYDDISMKRWGIFENYFKVGNYFQTRDKGAFAKVNLYELTVSH